MNVGEILIWESTNALLLIPAVVGLAVVFASAIGGFMDKSNAGDILSDIVARAGVKRLGSFQVLRHTFGSLLLSNRKDIAEVSRLLEHSDCSITLKIYSHFVPRKTEDDARTGIAHSLRN